MEKTLYLCSQFGNILGCASAIETSFIALGLHEHCQAENITYE